jgi:hypothetical protein
MHTPAAANLDPRYTSKSTLIERADTNAGNQKLMAEIPVVGLVRSLAARYPCK